MTKNLLIELDQHIRAFNEGIDTFTVADTLSLLRRVRDELADPDAGYACPYCYQCADKCICEGLLTGKIDAQVTPISADVLLRERIARVLSLHDIQSHQVEYLTTLIWPVVATRLNQQAREIHDLEGLVAHINEPADSEHGSQLALLLRQYADDIDSVGMEACAGGRDEIVSAMREAALSISNPLTEKLHKQIAPICTCGQGNSGKLCRYHAK
jgi:hypothetical protein